MRRIACSQVMWRLLPEAPSLRRTLARMSYCVLHDVAGEVCESHIVRESKRPLVDVENVRFGRTLRGQEHQAGVAVGFLHLFVTTLKH